MNFVGNLLNTVKSVGRSALQNPGSTSVNLFGTNVPLVPLVSYRNHFLRALSTWSGSIPNQTMWLVLIDKFPDAINTKMLQTLEGRGDGDGLGNDIDKNMMTTTGYLYQKIAGCVFAQGVNIPGEAVTMNYAQTTKQRGFIGGLYADPRQALQPLTIQFLETNTSFVDFVIRPWTILTSHLGLVARPDYRPENGSYGEENIKTNITIIQLAKTYQQRSSVQRKVWRFFNCTPARFDAANLPYNETGIQTYNVDFFYTHYTVGGIPFIPIEEIVSNFGSGKLWSIYNGIQQVTGRDPIREGVKFAKKILRG